MESVKIIAFSILAACTYGIAHDLVTTHVCIEYFLPPAHPIIVPTNLPLVLALIWGIIATWWVGLLFGVPLAVVCRIGQKPKMAIQDIVWPILFLLIFLYVASMLFGGLGYIAGNMKWIKLLSPLSEAVASERHALFLFDLWAHGAAYFLGAVGGIVFNVPFMEKTPFPCRKRCITGGLVRLKPRGNGRAAHVNRGERGDIYSCTIEQGFLLFGKKSFKMKYSFTLIFTL